MRFVTEAGQEREVDVHRFAGFTPPLDREAADETVPPAFGFTHILEFGRRTDDGIQGGGIRRKTRCCSMSPEVGFGARGGTR